MYALNPIVRLAILQLFLFVVPVGNAGEPVSFGRDVRPVLSDKCFICHGPNAEKRQADLRLDVEENAKEYVIVPGEPDDSELVVRITSEDPDVRMPPAGSKLTLTAREIEVLRRWIEQGAGWNSHWAFVAPGETPIPATANTNWPANEIDHFVIDRLHRQKLDPSPPASRERLIRRVTFDLTGLPPTLAEIDAFLADRSEAAWERLVDRLLESPRFGERMASSWLDVARYSDTYGYQVDRDRFVWPWRDWVVRALNDNMPYDQFIVEQLAGDLLPNATDEQILATTFNRLHPQKVEGGSTPEEFRTEYVADRTDTFGTAFLGMTFACARCHDHKYDPILQKEYYQVSAFFDNIDEAGLYSFFTQAVPTPTLLMASDDSKDKIDECAKRIACAVDALNSIRRSALSAAVKGTQSGEEPKAEYDLARGMSGRVAHLDFENLAVGSNEIVPGRFGKAVKLTGDDGIGTEVGNFHRYEPFSVTLWLNSPDQKQRAVVFHRSRAWTDAGSRGYQLLIEDGRLSASLIHFWPGNAIRVRTRDVIPIGQWLHVAMTYDGSSKADGLKIYLNGRDAVCDVIRDKLSKSITGGGGDNITIGERFRDRGFTGGLVDEFQVFNRRLTSLEIAHLCDGESLTKILANHPDQRTARQRELLSDYLLETMDADFKTRLEELKELRREWCSLYDGIPEIMVMREMSEPRPTYLLRRGAYDAPAEQVWPETPAALPPMGDDQPRNRLGLARWLTSPTHPLTARVAVNRFWQLVFGQALVATPEDFGSQGSPPTHPELLDWMARDFMTHGWDVKRLMKMMVMSATYRQSSDADEGTRARDPENLLWARASRYRLSAEMLRDNALAVSGLLVEKIGGAPSRPYEVEASFKPVARHQGEGLYRRSLYTYWKRTAPAPAMIILDAGKRDVCRMRRERTVSPLQTLVLMNGPQFVEAARGVAEKLVEIHGDAQDDVLAGMFCLLTSRHPSAEELGVLRDLYKKQCACFSEDQHRVEQYLATGDSVRKVEIDSTRLAAFSAVANALLNFDESVMKR